MPSNGGRIVAVPCPWAVTPIASPLATGSVILHNERKAAPIIVPSVPVKTTNATAIAGSPPVIIAISIAIGAVTDLGASDVTRRVSRPLHLANNTAVVRVDTEPLIIPAIIGNNAFRSICRFWYSGRASATVAGPSKNVIIALPGLYCSNVIPEKCSIIIIAIVLSSNGASRAVFAFRYIRRVIIYNTTVIKIVKAVSANETALLF